MLLNYKNNTDPSCRHLSLEQLLMHSFMSTLMPAGPKQFNLFKDVSVRDKANQYFKRCSWQGE